MDEKHTSKSKGSEATNTSDCTICLQQVFLPVKLPCGHIFCYLCTKGIIQQSNKCALCRQTIPSGYLNSPEFVQQEATASNNSYRWFYKGQSGWWQYDDRTNSEIETAYENKQQQCEVQIAGNLYIIDLTKNMQMQKHNPASSRRIKRDLETVYKIGVAGVYMDSIPDSDSCKSSCSKNDNCSKPTESEKLNRKTECIIILPSDGISGVNLNLDNNGLSLSTNSSNSKASASSNNCQQLPDPVNVFETSCVTKKCNNPDVADQESPAPSASYKVLPSDRNETRDATTSKNVIDDDSSLTGSESRKRKRMTDISEFTEDDINESYVATIFSKLQKMSNKQRLFSEKLINDTLFKGLLGKLTENSCLSESI